MSVAPSRSLCHRPKTRAPRIAETDCDSLQQLQECRTHCECEDYIASFDVRTKGARNSEEFLAPFIGGNSCAFPEMDLNPLFFCPALCICHRREK